MNKKGIVSFDLDMTLLDHTNWSIPDSAMRALDALRKDYVIVIASGRDMDTHYSLPYKEIVNPDAIIHLNGTKVTIGDEVIFEHFMDRELLARVVAFVKDKPYTIGVSVGDDDYFVNPDYVVKHDMLRWNESGRNFMPVEQLLDLSVRTLTYLGDASGVAEIEAAFPALKLPMFFGETGADVLEKTASKAEGLKRLCSYYQIDLAKTIAFGDSMNDYEIIQTAGIGVAMGNGLEQVKQVADYVTDHIQRDGIYKACIALGLIED